MLLGRLWKRAISLFRIGKIPDIRTRFFETSSGVWNNVRKEVDQEEVGRQMNPTDSDYVSEKPPYFSKYIVLWITLPRTFQRELALRSRSKLRLWPTSLFEEGTSFPLTIRFDPVTGWWNGSFLCRHFSVCRKINLVSSQKNGSNSISIRDNVFNL